MHKCDQSEGKSREPDPDSYIFLRQPFSFSFFVLIFFLPSVLSGREKLQRKSCLKSLNRKWFPLYYSNCIICSNYTVQYWACFESTNFIFFKADEQRARKKIIMEGSKSTDGKTLLSSLHLHFLRRRKCAVNLRAGAHAYTTLFLLFFSLAVFVEYSRTGNSLMSVKPEMGSNFALKLWCLKT